MNNNIDELIQKFNVGIPVLIERRQDLYSKRKEFTAYFSLDRISSMTLDDYCLGKSKDIHNFSYGLQWVLDGLGTINGRPGGSSLFGVWYSSTDETYKISRTYKKNFDSHVKAFNQIKKDIVELYHAGEKRDDDSIFSNSLDDWFKGKFLATYFPEEYLNVYSKENLEAYIDYFDIEPEYSDAFYLRKALLEYKNEHPIMKTWPVDIFGCFLWSVINSEIEEADSSVNNRVMINESTIPDVYRIMTKDEDQMKASFIHFMGDKDATSKQISEPTRTNNYANLDKDERVIKAVSAVTDFTNAYSIKSPDEIERVSQELLRLSNESEDAKQTKEYKNRRSYINKYKEFLNYCISLQETAATKSLYSFAEDVDRPFISEEKFNEIVALLRRKKNVILEGAPGVGKTFLARKVAYQLMGEAKDENIEMVQFHQSYSYEDFVQGIRPMANGEFKTRDGVFYEFCAKALTNPKEKYVFIIDEINRGNLSKILGELMMLIEANKRSPRYAIKLTYSDPDDEKFYVPDNVYILGCMNTADRSLSIVDYALRRRFAFFTIEPEFGKAFCDFLTQKFDDDFVTDICKRLIDINELIKQHPSLGKGMEIGHSYFCEIKEASDAEIWWQNICKYELVPYLREICFDDDDLLKELCKRLTI